MKLAYLFNYFICLLLCLCCNEDPNTSNDKEKLRTDFSESEFKSAIIGKWQSVLTIDGQENVIYLELSEQGDAKISLKKESTVEEFQGKYSIGFIRPPSPGTVTLAEITITTPQRNIILSRVCFDMSNAYPAPAGLLLRIMESPYGTLDRVE